MGLSLSIPKLIWDILRRCDVVLPLRSVTLDVVLDPTQQTNAYSKLRIEILGKTCGIWDKVFKNGPSNFCGRQPLKNLKGYGLLKQKNDRRTTSMMSVWSLHC